MTGRSGWTAPDERPASMTEPLAVTHRPRRFADLIGQRHVAAVLRSAAGAATPPQALLLAGNSGLGKTTVSRIFAAALNCEDRATDGDACGVCATCTDIAAGRWPDLVEMDAASNGGKDEIRELSSRAALAPISSPWRIFYLDEAHGLTGPGAQALLKLLEEPPAHALFILATTDPDKLPNTLRGRCVEIELIPPGREDLVANLGRIAGVEGWDVTGDVIDAVIDASDPTLGVRGVVTTLDKLSGIYRSGAAPTAAELAERLGVADPTLTAALFAAIDDGMRPEALLAVDRLRHNVADTQIRRALERHLRAAMLDACVNGDDETLAVWRYEKLVTAPAGPAWTDVAVAAIAGPHIDPTGGGLAAVVVRAEAVADTLGDLISAAAHTRTETTAPPAAAAADTSEPARTPTGSPVTVGDDEPPLDAYDNYDDGGVDPDEPVARPAVKTTKTGSKAPSNESSRRPRPAPAAPAIESRPAADAGVARRRWAKVELAVADVNPTAKGLLDQCDVDVADGFISVKVPAAIVDAGREAGLGDIVRSLAERHEVTVKMTVAR